VCRGVTRVPVTRGGRGAAEDEVRAGWGLRSPAWDVAGGWGWASYAGVTGGVAGNATVVVLRAGVRVGAVVCVPSCWGGARGGVEWWYGLLVDGYVVGGDGAGEGQLLMYRLLAGFCCVIECASTVDSEVVEGGGCEVEVSQFYGDLLVAGMAGW